MFDILGFLALFRQFLFFFHVFGISNIFLFFFYIFYGSLVYSHGRITGMLLQVASSLNKQLQEGVTTLFNIIRHIIVSRHTNANRFSANLRPEFRQPRLFPKARPLVTNSWLPARGRRHLGEHRHQAPETQEALTQLATT